MYHVYMFPLQYKPIIQLQMAGPFDGMGTFVLIPTRVFGFLPGCGREAVGRNEREWRRRAVLLPAKYGG